MYLPMYLFKPSIYNVVYYIPNVNLLLDIKSSFVSTNIPIKCVLNIYNDIQFCIHAGKLTYNGHIFHPKSSGAKGRSITLY